MRFEIDDSELRALEVDLRGAPLRVQFGARKVMRTRVGPALKDEMQQDAVEARRSSPTTIPKLPKAVSWETRDNGFEVEAGYDPGAGNHARLAHILWYGSVNNAPVGDHTAGLRRLTPRAVNWLADMAEDSVLGDEKGGR